jgi:hypothetical protein
MNPSPASAALCAALLAFAGSSWATAPNKETVISIAKPSTVVKSIEASAEIDTSLKSYSKLYANLSDEANRNVSKWLAELDSNLGKNPEAFGNGMMLSIYYRYTLRSKTGRYISIVRAESECGGGAHCVDSDNTILWDATAGKRTNIRSLFLETEPDGPTMKTLAKLARTEMVIATEEVARDFYSPQELAERSEYFKTIEPDLLKIGPISLAPSTQAGKSSGLTFHYSRALVRSYDTPTRMFVHWTAFAELLSAGGKQLFSGERPKSDSDEK